MTDSVGFCDLKDTEVSRQVSQLSAESLALLKVELRDFRYEVHQRMEQQTEILKKLLEKPVQGPSFSARLNTMQGTFRNSLMKFFPTSRQNSGDQDDDQGVTHEGGIETIEEEEVLQDRISPRPRLGSESPSAAGRKTELFFQSRSSTHSRNSRSSSKSSRNSFVRQSTVAHRQRAQSQAVRLRDMRVSVHLMPLPGALTKEFKDRQRCRYYASKIVSSTIFAYGITALILINVILLGIEVDYSSTVGQEEIPQWFGTANTIIVCFFILEIVLKFFALGCWNFWTGEDAAWNIFEFLIIVVSLLDVVLDFVMQAVSSTLNTGQLRLVRSIRLARALRSMRVMRLFRYVGALRTLVLSIISTMGSLLWTLALLLLIFYSFGVMLTQIVIDHCRYSNIMDTGNDNAVPKCDTALATYWQNVPESMLTLFMAISGGVSWDDAVRPLRDVSPLALALVIFYVVIAVFAVLNVVTGVFCNTAIESATIDKDVATIKQVQAKQHQVEHLRQIFQEIDRDNVSEVSFQDVQDAISNGDLSSFMEAVGISTDDVWTLCMLLDADKNGSIDLDEFVAGCMQLHGPAKSLQIAKMSFENKMTRQAIRNLGQETLDMKAQLSAIYSWLTNPIAANESF